MAKLSVSCCLLMTILGANEVFECQGVKTGNEICPKLLPQYTDQQILGLLAAERKKEKSLDIGWKKNEKKYNDLRASKKLGEFSGMNPESVVALMTYTGDRFYAVFNPATYALFNKGSLHSGWGRYPFKGFLLLMFKAFDFGDHVDCGGKKKLSVYRGMKGLFDIDKENNTDGTMTMKIFTSTSTDISIAKGFMEPNGTGTLLKYDVGGPFICLQRISVYPKQKEVLVPPFRNFELMSEKNANGVMELQLREVGEYCLENRSP